MGKEIEKTEDTRMIRNEPRKRTYNQIINDLFKEVPQRFVKQRKQGGKFIDYIAWYDACKLLEVYAPGWSYEIRRLEQFGDYFFIIVRVTLCCSDGDFFREATGCEKIDKDGYGDPSSNAESMALRRAFSKFGLALHLYDGDDSSYSNQSSNQNQQRSQSSGQSQSHTGGGNGGTRKPTEKQLNYLISLVEKQHLSEIDIVQEYTDGRAELFSDMTMAEVSKAIEDLK